MEKHIMKGTLVKSGLLQNNECPQKTAKTIQHLETMLKSLPTFDNCVEDRVAFFSLQQ
jgi:hypothetical protein